MNSMRSLISITTPIEYFEKKSTLCSMLFLQRLTKSPNEQNQNTEIIQIQNLQLSLLKCKLRLINPTLQIENLEQQKLTKFFHQICLISLFFRISCSDNKQISY
ncbi:unnamed protein product [Paramecium sonneborni]|uniref:Uncharacterized protein n=1 Tax=Paramecium sonneborni TaxID=65129 RepID=A0A8S1RA57_9CILI|nr:unnamed protein product [Paramecium sonneborni]